MFRSLKAPGALTVTLAAAGILMITMGMRQSVGLFLSPINTSTGLGVVTLSLALAIGRYLAQGARRLESVIIDEGFGCLDERGRDDMVNVLKELKAHLRRIILVSHQREFIDSFSHGYRISLHDQASVVQPLE